MNARSGATLAPVIPIGTARSRRELDTLHPAVAARYAAVVARVVPAIERSLAPAVLANRVAFSSVDPPLVALRAWRDERRVFARRLSLLRRSFPALLFTDVRACYASVAADVVASRLTAIGASVADVAAVGDLLRQFGRLGIVGLPVGPSSSAALANAVLGHLDDALGRSSAPFLRWVDDVVVALETPRGAAHTLRVIDAALASVGLRRHEAKTRIVRRGDDLGLVVSDRIR
jgi:hypothetical protein